MVRLGTQPHCVGVADVAHAGPLPVLSPGDRPVDRPLVSRPSGVLLPALTTNRDTIGIVMTGNPSVDSSVEALVQGAWDYLPKPFSATHLQVLIGRAVHTLLVARETPDQQAEPERRHVPGDKPTL